MERNLRPVFLSAVASSAFLLAGCNLVGTMAGPERFNPVPNEVLKVKAYVNENIDYSFFSQSKTSAELQQLRNEIIASRMYVIDMEYTEYESKLIREGQIIDFSTKVASGVLTTVSGLTPVLATSHALSETATLINGLDSAYNDKILRSQIIQNTIASMRTARHDQAAVIYANMYCPVAVYPIGFALSDLETYYRAGLFQTGIIKTAQVIAAAEVIAKANQDSNKPNPTADSQGKIAASAMEATVKDAKAIQDEAAKRNGTSSVCKTPASMRVSMDGPVRGSPIARIAPRQPTEIAVQRGVQSSDAPAVASAPRTRLQ